MTVACLTDRTCVKSAGDSAAAVIQEAPTDLKFTNYQ